MKARVNLAASIRQQLLNRAKARAEDFNFTLSQYAIERFLYRLGESRHAGSFAVKGATLFSLWSGETHRATWDLDLGGRRASPADVVKAIKAICEAKAADDGIQFDSHSVHAEPIRTDEEYEGVRVRLVARLADARIPVQVDVGFGDVIVPEPRMQTFPTMLGQASPRVLAYSRETVVAEKLEALVSLGPRNSRMKDFYDLHFLALTHDFAGAALSRAVGATFERRKTPIPDGIPFGLSEEFAAMPERGGQWRAFLRRGRLQERDSLAEMLALLRVFLLPVLAVVRGRGVSQEHWRAGGPWALPGAPISR